MKSVEQRRGTLDTSGKEQRVEKGKGSRAGHGAKHAFAVVVRDRGSKAHHSSLKAPV